MPLTERNTPLVMDRLGLITLPIHHTHGWKMGETNWSHMMHPGRSAHTRSYSPQTYASLTTLMENMKKKNPLN